VARNCTYIAKTSTSTYTTVHHSPQQLLTMATIVPLSTAKQADFISKYAFNNTSCDVGDQAFSASEALCYYETEENRQQGLPSLCVLAGFRDRDSTRKNAGSLALARHLYTASQGRSTIGTRAYREHRKTGVLADASAFPWDKEVFGSDEFVVLTTSQLKHATKVMLLEPPAWLQRMDKSYKKRKFDKDLTLRAMGVLDPNEWYYIAASIVDEALEYDLPLENSMSRGDANMAPTLYSVRHCRLLHLPAVGMS
jgi:hypothetical protein